MCSGVTSVVELVVTLGLLLLCLPANGGSIGNRSEEALNGPPIKVEWKDDVVDTLDTLKQVLVTFEKKWDEVPLEDENSTIAKDNITMKTLKDVDGELPAETIKNEFANERRPIKEDLVRRAQGEKLFGCPHAWPYHDAYPVSEPLCEADSDCKTGELCCQLFNSNYCLRALDATPRPGECRFIEFNFLAALHCLVDDPGCKHDSECSEPTWKCCQGPCSYKECFPSTVSPSAADLAKEQQRRQKLAENAEITTSSNTENNTNTVTRKLVALPSQQPVDTLPQIATKPANTQNSSTATTFRQNPSASTTTIQKPSISATNVRKPSISTTTVQNPSTPLKTVRNPSIPSTTFRNRGTTPATVQNLSTPSTTVRNPSTLSTIVRNRSKTTAHQNRSITAQHPSTSITRRAPPLLQTNSSSETASRSAQPSGQTTPDGNNQQEEQREAEHRRVQEQQAQEEKRQQEKPERQQRQQQQQIQQTQQQPQAQQTRQQPQVQQTRQQQQIQQTRQQRPRQQQRQRQHEGQERQRQQQQELQQEQQQPFTLNTRNNLFQQQDNLNFDEILQWPSEEVKQPIQTPGNLPLAGLLLPFHALQQRPVMGDRQENIPSLGSPQPNPNLLSVDPREGLPNTADIRNEFVEIDAFHQPKDDTDTDERENRNLNFDEDFLPFFDFRWRF